PDKPRGFFDATADGGWAVPGEPYTNASSDPREQFTWWRARMLGGRTNHWGRISLRNGPYDFKPYSRDGLGFDWPLDYEDVAPYYDRVERLIGVYGESEGLENSPDSPPGVLLPPPRARAGERFTAKHAPKLGIQVVPIHRAVLSARLDADRVPALLHPGNLRAQRILRESMHQRAACFWATHCHRGCSIGANCQSTTVHLPPALATGNLDLLTEAAVREVVVNASGRATGVIFIDKRTGGEGRASARAVVLAASSAESVRILLNTRSNRFKEGLGNGSGLLGKYVMDSVGASVDGQVPALESLPLHNEDGAGGPHVYIPWWLHGAQRAGKLDFPRGYHVEFATGRQMPGVGILSGLEWLTGGTYGRRLRADARRYYGSFIGYTGRGEMIPNEGSFAELDPTVKDRWGIPVLRFHWKWSDHELRQVAHMQRSFADLIEAMGGRVRSRPDRDPRDAIAQGGAVIHEVGGAIMGADPKRSVTNRWGQVWEAKNVVIADGATFPSSADKNPTLTILALAWRACDHLIEELRKGDL
ncbi:MAG: GMC family oxidoreductase, partial [Opitutaceae bacterium]|nr:GMC family oxidoreductase [Opitutaceae bacterium]